MTPIYEKQDVTAQEVVDYIETLLAIDSTKLDEESLKTNRIFSSLYRLKHVQDKKLRSLIQVKAECEHERWLRYSGKATARHYQEEPLNITVLKTDIEKYMSVDKKIVLVREAVSIQDAVCSLIEEAIKQVGRRGFEIKNAIEWKKLIKG